MWHNEIIINCEEITPVCGGSPSTPPSSSGPEEDNSGGESPCITPDECEDFEEGRDGNAGRDQGLHQIPDSCKTGNELLDHEGVQSGLTELWNESYHPNQSERKEKAGFILKNNMNGQTVLIPAHYFMYQQEPTPCKNEVRIPGDFESQGYTLLGYVHTHPFEPGEEFTAATADACDGRINAGDRYNREPSQEDLLAERQMKNNYPGIRSFFFDKQGVVEFSLNASGSNPILDTKGEYDNRKCF